jgi:hypothetical protein
VLLAGVAVALGIPLTLLVRGSSSDDGATWGGTLILGLLAVLAVLTMVSVARMLAGVDPEIPELAGRLADAPDEQRLLARWLSRARWARNVGGFCGLVVWLLGTQGSGDILAWGVGGIALGAMAAELHHVKPAPGPRTAMMEPRSVADYLLEADSRRMLAVGVIAALVMLAGVFLDDGGSASWAGFAAVVVLGAARGVQRRVATRPRPAIAEGLRRADDLARQLAIGRGLARPATFFALALIARGSWLLVPAIGDVMGIVAIVAWLYALRLWWTNRRLGLDHLLDQPEAVLA